MCRKLSDKEIIVDVSKMVTGVRYMGDDGMIYKINKDDKLTRLDIKTKKWSVCNIKYNDAKDMKFQPSDFKCTHRDDFGNLTIDYDCSYERRSSQMHCVQCEKCGTKDEFENGVT